MNTSLMHSLILSVLWSAPLDEGPPWEGTYKIRPHEVERLTEADVVGPDGVVYPDWTR